MKTFIHLNTTTLQYKFKQYQWLCFSRPSNKYFAKLFCLCSTCSVELNFVQIICFVHIFDFNLVYISICLALTNLVLCVLIFPVHRVTHRLFIQYCVKEKIKLEM
jgi:uncharacterized membrane protein